MPKKLIILLLLVISACHKTEYTDASTANMIAAVSDASVIMKPNKIDGYSLDSKARAILKIKNRNLYFYLSRGLTQDGHALVSHILLTKLLFSGSDRLEYHQVYNKTKDTLLKTTYSLNGIQWETDKQGANRIIDYDPNALNERWLSNL